MLDQPVIRAGRRVSPGRYVTAAHIPGVLRPSRPSLHMPVKHIRGFATDTVDVLALGAAVRRPREICPRAADMEVMVKAMVLSLLSASHLRDATSYPIHFFGRSNTTLLRPEIRVYKN
jgi:hypothetical protein